MVQYTDRYGGVPKDLNLPGFRVWWCPSDKFNLPIINPGGSISTNSFSSWFIYGPPNGTLNTDNPNIGGDVHTGWDLK